MQVKRARLHGQNYHLLWAVHSETARGRIWFDSIGMEDAQIVVYGIGSCCQSGAWKKPPSIGKLALSSFSECPRC